jgi:hypothetical protein
MRGTEHLKDQKTTVSFLSSRRKQSKVQDAGKKKRIIFLVSCHAIVIIDTKTSARN